MSTALGLHGVQCTVLVANDHHIITKQHLSVSSQCNTIILTPLPPAGNQPTWTMHTATTYMQLWGGHSEVLAREPPSVTDTLVAKAKQRFLNLENCLSIKVISYLKSYLIFFPTKMVCISPDEIQPITGPGSMPGPACSRHS